MGRGGEGPNPPAFLVALMLLVLVGGVLVTVRGVQLGVNVALEDPGAPPVAVDLSPGGPVVVPPEPPSGPPPEAAAVRDDAPDSPPADLAAPGTITGADGGAAPPQGSGSANARDPVAGETGPVPPVLLVPPPADPATGSPADGPTGDGASPVDPDDEPSGQVPLGEASSAPRHPAPGLPAVPPPPLSQLEGLPTGAPPSEPDPLEVTGGRRPGGGQPVDPGASGVAEPPGDPLPLPGIASPPIRPDDSGDLGPDLAGLGESAGLQDSGPVYGQAADYE